MGRLRLRALALPLMSVQLNLGIRLREAGTCDEVSRHINKREVGQVETERHPVPR